MEGSSLKIVFYSKKTTGKRRGLFCCGFIRKATALKKEAAAFLYMCFMCVLYVRRGYPDRFGVGGGPNLSDNRNGDPSTQKACLLAVLRQE